MFNAVSRNNYFTQPAERKLILKKIKIKRFAMIDSRILHLISTFTPMLSQFDKIVEERNYG